MRVANLRVMVGVALFLALAPAIHAASEFTFQIPKGWVNLRDPNVIANKIPQSVMQEAMSGKYVVYAVDLEAVTADGAAASFNAIEQPVTGRVTDAVLRQTATEMTSGAAKLGATISVTESHVAKLGGVDVGVMTSDMNTARGSMRLLQYLIPGKTHSAVLTYGSVPGTFDRYRPAFESAAMATTGAYDHSSINWMRAMLFGGLGGLIALILGAVNARKKPKVAPMVSTRTMPGGRSVVWDCPTCKRRVPLRMDQCRCGAPRPAG
ncbi:MAG: hypothetical protein ACXW19_12405 [Thermoanaerobaculia bacterium]